MVVKSNTIVNFAENDHLLSLEMLSTIFDLNPDAIALTKVDDGEFIDCNQEFLNQTGYSRGEVIGHTSLELELYSSDKRQAYVNEIRRKKILRNFEVKLKRKDGNFIYILYSARFITIGGEKILLNIGKDITKLKKAEKKLKQSETRFHSVFENSPDVIYRFNLKTGHYEYMSPAIRTLNYEPEELTAMSNKEVLSRVHPDDMPLLISDLSRLNDTDKVLSEYRFQDKDGNYLWWSNQMVIIRDSEGKPHYRDGFVRDITKRKQSEEILQTTLKRFYTILSSMYGAILLVTNHDTVEYANQAFCDLFELDEFPKDLIGLNSQKVIEIIRDVYLHSDDAIKRIEHIVTQGKPVKGEEVALKGGRTCIRDFIPLYIYKKSYGRLWHHMDITERKKAENALRESEELFRIIFDQSPIGSIISSLDYSPIQVNNAFSNMLGYSKEELLLMKFYEYVYPEDLKAELEQKKLLISGGIDYYSMEKRYIHKDGRIIWGKLSVSAVKDRTGKPIYVLKIVEDITKGKQAELEIKRHGKLMEGINQVFQEALTCETEGEVVVKCLEVAEKLTDSEFGFFGEINEHGRLDDRVLSPPAWDLCETPNSEELLKDMEIVSYWGRTITEEKSQIVNDPDSDPDRRGLPDGHPPITSFLGVPLKQGLKTMGMIALANKKTGYSEIDMKNIETLSVVFVETLMRKKAEVRLKEYVKNLARSNRELEQFSYITSHDLREPLRMITSFLQLLERRYKDRLDQDANEFIAFAVDGAKRLDNMINDLLSYSQITSKDRELNAVRLEKVLEEVLMNLKIPLDESDAIVTHDPLPIILADEKLMVQLLQNLIGNAIKYRSHKTPEIHISSVKEKNRYLFSVMDNGIGMSPEHLERIFTIFQRLHTKEEYEGTGIGLAIAQKIVNQHSGKIWAESEPGKGTTFYFTIMIPKNKLVF